MKHMICVFLCSVSLSVYCSCAQGTTNVVCPCVQKIDDNKTCLCCAQGRSCNCSIMYAQGNPVAENCPCPKITVNNHKPDNAPLDLRIPVPYGELVDKITILELKSVFITDPEKRANVVKELALLKQIFEIVSECNSTKKEQLLQLKEMLHEVNLLLWNTEEELRKKEEQKIFDSAFTQLARTVYITNDKRARIKRAISELLCSPIIEEKSHDNL
jgi:hypothetical protein